MYTPEQHNPSVKPLRSMRLKTTAIPPALRSPGEGAAISIISTPTFKNLRPFQLFRFVPLCSVKNFLRPPWGVLFQSRITQNRPMFHLFHLNFVFLCVLCGSLRPLCSSVMPASHQARPKKPETFGHSNKFSTQPPKKPRHSNIFNHNLKNLRPFQLFAAKILLPTQEISLTFNP
jgi:hypothetical protein